MISPVYMDKKHPAQGLEISSGPKRFSLFKWQLSPFSGKLSVDLFHLLIILLLQTAILPSVTGDFIRVDLLTPWLILNFVFQTIPRSFLILFLGSFYLETISSVPIGMYLCIYTVLAGIILLVRDTISWRNLLPWLTVLFIAELVVMIFEFFTASVRGAIIDFRFQYLSGQLSRLLLATFFGFFLFQLYKKQLLKQKEPV